MVDPVATSDASNVAFEARDMNVSLMSQLPHGERSAALDKKNRNSREMIGVWRSVARSTLESIDIKAFISK
jgi:hypothetical protein